MDRIGLEGMVFYGYHGVHEEERRLGQRFVVDVELGLDTSGAGVSDALGDTANYSDAYRIVKTVLEGPSRSLLESLAEETAQRLLESLPRVRLVRVRVSKPSVPIKGPLQRAWVEVVRRRRRGDTIQR
jgi:dihydroneopterin aldolase